MFRNNVAVSFVNNPFFENYTIASSRPGQRSCWTRGNHFVLAPKVNVDAFSYKRLASNGPSGALGPGEISPLCLGLTVSMRAYRYRYLIFLLVPGSH